MFPITGIFMMMLGGPIWSTVLINLAFALMARDVFTGQASRWMLLPPLLWFGGYLVVAAVSHREVSRFNAALISSNVHSRLPFDPSKQDLLIETNNPSYDADGGEQAMSPEALIRAFALTRAYSHWKRPATGEETYRKFNLVTSPCYFDPSGKSHASEVYDEGDGKGRLSAHAGELCIYSYAEEPQLPVVRVTAGPEQRRRGLVEAVTQSIRVQTPDGRAILLNTGSANALTWLPEPVIGCGLGDGHYGCFSTFTYEGPLARKGDPTSAGPDDALARALGLTKESVRNRFPGAAWRESRRR